MPSYHTHNIEHSILPEFEPKPAKSPARRFFALSERFGSHLSSATSTNGKFRDSRKRSADTSLPPLPPMPLHLPMRLCHPCRLFTSRSPPLAESKESIGPTRRPHRTTNIPARTGSGLSSQTVEIVKTPNDARRGMRTGVPSWGTPSPRPALAQAHSQAFDRDPKSPCRDHLAPAAGLYHLATPTDANDRSRTPRFCKRPDTGPHVLGDRHWPSRIAAQVSHASAVATESWRIVGAVTRVPMSSALGYS